MICMEPKLLYMPSKVKTGEAAGETPCIRVEAGGLDKSIKIQKPNVHRRIRVLGTSSKPSHAQTYEGKWMNILKTI